MLFNILTTILTARFLGAHTQGELGIYLLVFTLLVAFISIGQNHSLAYHAKLIQPEILLNASLHLFLIISSAYYFLAAGYILFLSNKSENYSLVLLILASVPLGLLNLLIQSFLRSQYKIRESNIINLIYPLTMFLFIATAVIILKSLTLTLAIIIHITSFFLSCIIGIFFLKKYSIFHHEFSKKKLLTQLLKFGLSSHFGNIAKDLMYKTDLFLADYFLTSTEVGNYYIATKVVEGVQRLPDAVGSVLLPRLIMKSDVEEINDKKIFFKGVVRKVSMLVVLISALFFTFGESIIVKIYGDDYSLAGKLTKYLVIGLISVTHWKLLANFMISQGKLKVYLYSSLFGLSILIVVNLLTQPKIGAYGAVIGNIISYTSAALFLIWCYRLYFTKKTKDI